MFLACKFSTKTAIEMLLCHPVSRILHCLSVIDTFFMGHPIHFHSQHNFLMKCTCLALPQWKDIRHIKKICLSSIIFESLPLNTNWLGEFLGK